MATHNRADIAHGRLLRVLPSPFVSNRRVSIPAGFWLETRFGLLATIENKCEIMFDGFHTLSSAEPRVYAKEDSVFKHTLQLFLAAWLTTGTLWAATDPFVGKWKLDPSQSKETHQMKIEAAGPNRYVFDFGAGGTETIVADGTEQPGHSGTILSLTSVKPNTWKLVRKKDGFTVVTAIFKLSADAQTLSDNFTAARPDGWTFNIDYVFTRTAGRSGLAGRWETSNEKLNSVYELEIQPYQGDGLALLLPAEHSARKMKFDGKDYPDQGAEVAPGSAPSGLRVNDHTLEITDKINGRTIDTQRITLSPDLNILTMTVRQARHSKSDTLAFNRE